MTPRAANRLGRAAFRLAGYESVVMFFGTMTGLAFWWAGWNPFAGLIVGYLFWIVALAAVLTYAAGWEAKYRERLDLSPLTWEQVSRYSNAVGRHGPGSPEAEAVRADYPGDAAFGEFADSLDRLKRRLGGSGVDWPPRG